MPEAPNISGRRKVRCPKCTARLTEPPTLIYKCPICSTLLLAKGNHDDSSDKLSENKLRGDGRYTEINHQSPEGRGKVEKASATMEPVQIQGHRGMEHMENDRLPTKESNRPSCLDSPDNKVIDKGVFNYVQEDVQSSTLDGQPLHMRKYHRPKPIQTEAFARKVDPLSSEMPPYTLRWRSSAPSSVKSCESSDKSEQGKFLSGLKTPSYDGSETEYDFPASSSENSHVAELPETTPSNSQIEGILLEDKIGEAEVPVRSEENELEYEHDEFDYRGGAQQESSGHVLERHREPCFLRGPGNKGSVMNGAGERDYDAVSSDGMDESLVDLGNSRKDGHPSEVVDSGQNDRLQGSSSASSVRNDSVDDLRLSSSYLKSSEVAANSHTDRSHYGQTESSVQNETVVDFRNSLCDDLSLEVGDSENRDRLHSKLSDSGDLTTPAGDRRSTNSKQSCSNRMTLEPTECRRQSLDDCVTGSVLVNGDGIGDDRSQWSKELLSSLSQQARDMGMEANPCHTDFLKERLVNTDISDSLDMPLCDWQCVQLSKVNASSKGNYLEAVLVDEKRVVDSNMAVVAGLSAKVENDIIFSTSQEVTGLSQSHLNQKEVSVIQNQALLGLNKSDSSSTIFITTGSGAHLEKPVVKQKFLQRTKEELVERTQPYQSEANIGNDPCVGDVQSYNLSTTDRMDQSDLAMVVSDRRRVNISLLEHLSPSIIQGIDRKPAPSSWRENPVTAIQSCFREDGHFRKELTLGPSQDDNRAVMQETALTDQCTYPGMSAVHVFGPGHRSRGYHHLEGKKFSSERMQMNENEGNVSPIFRRQESTSGHCVDTHMAAFNPNRQGLYAQQGKYLNPEFSLQPHPLHGIWQEHGTHLQCQKFQSEQNAMEHGSHCLFCVPSNTFNGYSRRCDESVPHFHPNEQYPSGLSSSTASGVTYPFQVSSQKVILPATMHEHVFGQCGHHPAPPVCAFCTQQPQARQQMLQKPMQHHCAVCFSQPASMMTHQPSLPECWESWAHHMLPSSYADSPVGLCQTSQLSPHSISHARSDVQFQPHAPLARKQKRYPPLPVEGAAPYVLCQNCNQLLQVPANLSPNSENFQKLRCGACGKVSRFSIHDRTKFQSSNVSLATNSMGQAMSVPHLVQPSTVHKPFTEASTIHLPVHGPSFLSDSHGRWLPISRAIQSVKPPHQQASFGMTDRSSSLLSPCERVENKQVSHQTNASARTVPVTEKVDHMCHVRPVTGAVEGHELSQTQLRYGDGDSSGMPSEYYLSSLPSSTGDSSPPENASGCQATENQNVHSTTDEQDRSGLEAIAISNDHHLKHSSEIITKFSHMHFQDSLPEQNSQCSGDEPPGHDQVSLTVKSQQQRLMESDFSRSMSESSAAQLSKWSAAPCSPLSEHSRGSVDLVPDLNQRRSHQEFGNGVKSAPWLPAPGSPLYGHLLHDALSDFDDKSHQKDQDMERAHVHRGRKYFAGLIKRSFKDFGKGSQGNNNRAKLIVNGQLLHRAAVKKAEEQAGSIHPGSYWYDYRAGFWGAMGGHCLGIIPPFIEEFNYPLAKDCSGGRTGILVNGRELHEKDLEVLARRGLPITPDKAYIVDISGRVVDDASGQRMRSLGKLAPTVERKGCGYGMFQQSAVQLGTVHSHI